jgi:hypothetical protein
MSPANATPKAKPAARATAVPEPEVDPRFAPVVAAFRKDARVTAGRMFSAFGLKVDGKIFAMLPRGVFVAKLPKARVDALVAAKRGVPFDPGHGRLMKEWIAIDGDAASWVALAKEAREFVGGAGAPVSRTASRSSGRTSRRR